jgi:hypothetical protein
LGAFESRRSNAITIGLCFRVSLETRRRTY